MRLRLFVCVVCCVLGVSNANAIMCDIEDVPIDSVVTNFGSSSCGGTRKNLVVAKFTGHTNDINICSFYNQARDYRNDGVLIFPPDRYQEPLQVSTSACKSRGYLRHLSKLSGIGHTCGDR